MTHDPTLGRMSRASPQFMRSSDGSWLGTSAFIERMTHMSSTHSARCGKISLTSMPDFPCLTNLYGDAMAAHMVREMLDQVNDPGRSPAHVVLDTELVLRDST